jgi:hypothetical protein
MTESHGSIATVKSHRKLEDDGSDALGVAAWLLADVHEYGNRIFGKTGWRLIDMRFTREMIADGKKSVLYLSVTARLEPK